MKQLTFDILKETFKRLNYVWESDKPMIIGIRTPFKTSNILDDYVILAWESKGYLDWLQATTEPGSFYLQHPSNPNGTAIMLPGQYIKAYSLGIHGAPKHPHKALRLTGRINITRDKDKDDIPEKGLNIWNVGSETGINIHSTGIPHYIPQRIDNWSAGCQVVANFEEFEKKIISRIEEYLNKFPSSSFTYTLLTEDQL